MRQSQMVVVFCLVFIGLLSTACGGSNSPASSEANRVATRVAEELSVAATLTALAPPGEKPTTPAPTDIVAEVTAPPAQTAVATPAQIATEVTVPTHAPPAASCRVITAGLNLRPGPGTVYNPRLPRWRVTRSFGRCRSWHAASPAGNGSRSRSSRTVVRAGWVRDSNSWRAIWISHRCRRCAAAHTDARADGHAACRPPLHKSPWSLWMGAMATKIWATIAA